MIDKYGEGLYPDLKFYYDVDLIDVIEGRGPAPLFVIQLILRLPGDSLTAALMRGDRKFFGWTEDRAILSYIYDALNMNTRATGNWKNGKAPKIPPYPRPDREPEKPKPASIKDLFEQFQQRR